MASRLCAWLGHSCPSTVGEDADATRMGFVGEDADATKSVAQ
ncbi:MAG: hypothetical protein ACK4ME_08800 [Fimbriimonadales bacterium]